MHVLYKGHAFFSYAQLYTAMSFTRYYKGHSISVGPERASRGIQSSLMKQECFTKELWIFSLKEHIQNIAKRIISLQELIPPTLIVHNIPPF